MRTNACLLPKKCKKLQIWNVFLVPNVFLSKTLVISNLMQLFCWMFVANPKSPPSNTFLPVFYEVPMENKVKAITENGYEPICKSGNRCLNYLPDSNFYWARWLRQCICKYISVYQQKYSYVIIFRIICYAIKLVVHPELRSHDVACVPRCLPTCLRTYLITYLPSRYC